MDDEIMEYETSQIERDDDINTDDEDDLMTDSDSDKQETQKLIELLSQILH